MGVYESEIGGEGRARIPPRGAPRQNKRYFKKRERK